MTGQPSRSSSRLATDPAMLGPETELTRPPLSARVLARRLDEVPRSGIRRFFDIMATMTDVISLGVGEPDFDTPQQVIEAGQHSLAARRTHYTSNYGTIELRRALAHTSGAPVRRPLRPDREGLITSGRPRPSMPPLGRPWTRRQGDPARAVLRLLPAGRDLRRGDAGGVATTLDENFAPIRPGSRRHHAADQGDPARLPVQPDWRVDAPRSPGEIARIAVRHDLLVYSDEIYDRLVYGGYEMRSMAALPGMRHRTILIGGFSKDYAMTGWRDRLHLRPVGDPRGILKVHQYMIMCAPTMSQIAALEALEHGEPDVARMVDQYDKRRSLLVVGSTPSGCPRSSPRAPLRLSADRLYGAEQRRVRRGTHPRGVRGGGARHRLRRCGGGLRALLYATNEAELREALFRIGRFVRNRRAEACGRRAPTTPQSRAAGAGTAPTPLPATRASPRHVRRRDR